MKRLNSNERKRLIARALLPLFARQGFAATTTKQMAASAGVSEALLYKYFPSKESLYAAIEAECYGSMPPLLEELLSMPDNAETVVLLIYGMFRQIIQGDDRQWFEASDFHRLMFFSYLSDGTFAKLTHEIFLQRLLGKVQACIENARAAGDMVNTRCPSDYGSWFCHNLAASCALMELSGTRTVPYSSDKPLLVENSVLFSLRGLGFTDTALERLVDFNSLSEQFQRLHRKFDSEPSTDE
jgi:TetR/AcrR family transcriptional regulator, transcriptional repressor of aconitase